MPTRDAPTRVAIIGAGYGGAALAHELAEHADVTVIEPRDAFINVAGSLRAITRPDWATNIFFPLSHIMTRGRHLRDRAVSVDPKGVDLASGHRVDADHIVLATGSTYPYPANPVAEETASALLEFRATHEQLAPAARVLILGAGPVGLELAAETREVWPDKAITIVDPAPDLLPGFLPRVRAALVAQLAALRIEVISGAGLDRLPDRAPATLGAISVRTTQGRTIDADIWFRAHGVSLNTSYLADGRLISVNDRGEVPVNDDLTVGEHQNVHAIGDITNLPEAKMAGYAGQHAAIVAQNIRSLIQGDPATATYRPLGYPMILLPLGSSGGVGQLPSAVGPTFAEPAVVTQYKGHDIFTARFAEQFGIAGVATLPVSTSTMTEH